MPYNVPALDNLAVVAAGENVSQCPDAFVVTELEVYNVLTRLSVHKASLCDIIDNGLLRALAACLSAPIIMFSDQCINFGNRRFLTSGSSLELL